MLNTLISLMTLTVITPKLVVTENNRDKRKLTLKFDLKKSLCKLCTDPENYS